MVWDSEGQDELSAQHQTSPRLPSGKASAGPAPHPISIGGWNTWSPAQPGYTVRSELLNRGPVLSFGMNLDVNFIASFCSALSHVPGPGTYYPTTYQTGAERKAKYHLQKTTINLFQKILSFLWKSWGVGLLVNTIFWHPDKCFSLENWSSMENIWKNPKQKTQTNQFYSCNSIPIILTFI